MKFRVKMAFLAMTACVTLGAGSTARAGLVYNFSSNGTGDLHSSSSTFTVSSLSVVASGYKVNSGNLGVSSDNLYSKTGGGTGPGAETGLGTNSGISGELSLIQNGQHAGQAANFIVLNVSALSTYGNTASILFGSDTGAEGFSVFASNSAAGSSVNFSQLAFLGSGNTSHDPININWGSYAYLYVAETTASPTTVNNVLLQSLTVNSGLVIQSVGAPEPSTIASAALGGLVFLGLARRRARRAA